MNVRKKDGTIENFDVQKIINACDKAAYRSLTKFTTDDYTNIINKVLEFIDEEDIEDEITVDELHVMVENALDEIKPVVAKSYRDYRNYKVDFVHMLDDVYKKSQSIMYIGDKENANTDSALVSTKRSLIFNQLNKELYQKFFMTTEEIQACRDGYIYVHDMSARRDTMNCCLFDVASVLKGGFEMGNVWYNEPKTLDVAFDVIGDIVLSAASQQYGGFTVPEVDKILSPYAEKSYEKYKRDFFDIMGRIEDTDGVFLDCASNVTFENQAHDYAMEKIQRDFEQGYQGWEYKFNTVSSSRGDYPFITITFGLGTSVFEKMCSKTILRVRREGQGKPDRKVPVLFPKLVFLYTDDLHDMGKINEDVFEEGILTSSKTMYPDWLSLDGDTTVSKMYHQYGKVISPMGCVDGKELITYKFNNKLYVEAFERMWNRLSDSFPIHHQYDIENNPNLYMDLKNVDIYDTEKGFVKTEKIIRNIQSNWVDLKLSNGRRLLCTSDHPLTLRNGLTKKVKDLEIGDKILINSNQYNEENILFNSDKAWLLGFMICDGCYQNNNLFASIAPTGEDDIAEKFQNVMKKYFDLDVDIVLQERGKKGNYKDLIARSNGDYISKYGSYFTGKFEGVNKLNRHIPNEVFSWNYEAKLSFLAGMIDADGHVNKHSHGGSVVQLGSTNKELALQQMALAQALGMPAKLYHNHYSKTNNKLVRYRIEFYPTEELISYIVCEKKRDCYSEMVSNHYNTESTVEAINYIETTDYSYDVTTDSGHFEVSGIYSHNCRAFLSPWYEHGGKHPIDNNDNPVFVGRFNIGAISLHLPMILAKARHENKDFYEVLDYYLNLIRQLHIRTYAYLGEMRASTNPLAYCEGGFYNPETNSPAYLNPSDKIKPILKAATASFGITAFNEFQELYNGKSLVEDGEFALSTLKYINEKINGFKKEDGNLYAIYGTPAENLCGLQIKQFRAKYGIIENVSDKPYVSNSFHCHVTEDITPIQKQDLEGRFWNLSEGGRIQYVKYPIDYNLEAIRTLVRRAMNMGFYEGVNLSLAYCNDCGHQELEMDVCPICGSSNLTKIERMNGYLSYSRVHGDTRLNDAKMAEIADRRSM